MRKEGTGNNKTKKGIENTGCRKERRKHVKTKKSGHLRKVSTSSLRLFFI